MTPNTEGIKMNTVRKVYLDGKIYVCRGNNIVRVK
ncbi:hypothetical protein CH25_gp10 [Mycobacterium phage EagleEye]|uniref:Uncharacterized protein n=1 Tax=Mycobacterium phage EagleEye TaxID=1429759 RepID=W0LJA9_9CAUD|nr:hypothetical protein CH25_gp10 [Mycobacterium phage EagleEye]AHG23876.1 hypothetical protein PBI_EAGLEEYE_96 [Mycobacterium phage EagleEye]QDK03528.1 hypothetical protein SEA_LUCYEDI_94 [Mycobacterium phage Lucyedi]QNJ55868.1 hypothetical protein SEA_PAINTERBOY_93 [Mycobacterium phage PainterBoy]